MVKILEGQAPYLDYDEAARYIRKSRSWMEKQVALQKVPFHKLGANVIFKREDLDRIIEAERVEPAGGTTAADIRTGMKKPTTPVIPIQP